MTFDYKKEFKELYNPTTKPHIIDVPEMNFILIEGTGNPNEKDGKYSQAIELLYAVAYTIKMSYKGDYNISGFFEYVVPPLEGFWWQDGVKGVDAFSKENFKWIALIRLPEFVTESDFLWAIAETTKKNKKDYSNIEFRSIREGLCVQAMHIGPYIDEPNTVDKMHKYISSKGYELDINSDRYHHEIYLNNPSKTPSEKLKTVIRHPIKLSK